VKLKHLVLIQFWRIGTQWLPALGCLAKQYDPGLVSKLHTCAKVPPLPLSQPAPLAVRLHPQALL
jgi:hypothetical protein